MAENVKVSVVVPTYNHEKYIAHAIESAVTQRTGFKYEIIVGEDCSTDGTAAIVKEYAEKYPGLIVPVLRKKNLGMSANTYDILMRTQGEYIAFLEGDDYWIDKNKLQKQADFLDSHADYVAVFGLCQIVDENELRHFEIERYGGFMKKGGEYTIKEFQEYILPGQTASSMYRKKAYEKLQKKLMDADIDVARMIDRDQVLCMLSVGKMYVLEEEISAYRYVLDQSSGSWSSKNDYYSAENVINYLKGMKNMEKMASALGLLLCFDDRRRKELEKLGDMKKSLNNKEVKAIRKTIMTDFNSKSGLFMLLLKRQLGRIKKQIHA